LSIEEQRDTAEDAVHRRADLVAHHREEVGLGLRGGAGAVGLNLGIFLRGGEVAHHAIELARQVTQLVRAIEVERGGELAARADLPGVLGEIRHRIEHGPLQHHDQQRERADAGDEQEDGGIADRIAPARGDRSRDFDAQGEERRSGRIDDILVDDGGVVMLDEPGVS
jgi:hypothetical protein